MFLKKSFLKDKLQMKCFIAKSCFSSKAKEEESSKLSEIVSLCKRRGFANKGSEIYGGLGGTFDYGPLGAQLKKNIRDLWWKDFPTWPTPKGSSLRIVL